MPTVLVIDDDRFVLDVLSRTLTRSGFTVVTADNGEAGLEAIGAQAIDCVLTDVFMPFIEGIGMLAEIRKRAPGLPVIVMSGGGRIGGPDYLSMAARLGAAATLTKPIDRDRLVETVTQVIEDRADRSAARAPADGPGPRLHGATHWRDR